MTTSVTGLRLVPNTARSNDHAFADLLKSHGTRSI
jgi:hypothetical protein